MFPPRHGVRKNGEWSKRDEKQSSGRLLVRNDDFEGIVRFPDLSSPQETSILLTAL